MEIVKWEYCNGVWTCHHPRLVASHQKENGPVWDLKQPARIFCINSLLRPKLIFNINNLLIKTSFESPAGSLKVWSNAMSSWSSSYPTHSRCFYDSQSWIPEVGRRIFHQFQVGLWCSRCVFSWLCVLTAAWVMHLQAENTYFLKIPGAASPYWHLCLKVAVRKCLTFTAVWAPEESAEQNHCGKLTWTLSDSEYFRGPKIWTQRDQD